MDKINYTEKELAVMEEIKELFEYSDYNFASELSTFDTKILRGVLSSLVKKGAIDINVEDGGLLTIFDDNFIPEKQ